MSARLLYLVTEDWYFCSHRLELARAARAAGYEVTVVTRVRDHADPIRAAGLRLVPVDFPRAARRPWQDLRLLWQLAGIYRRERPDIAHHVALKAVLYGSLAARLGAPAQVVNALTGLGFVFTSNAPSARLLRLALAPLLGLALDHRRTTVIVQNADDRAFLRARWGLAPERVRLIRGSGVDLQRFRPRPLPEGVPVVALVGRLIADKGVREFAAAARRLHAEGIAARFVLIGAPDPENPGSIADAELEAWRAAGVVEYWGWREDMAGALAQVSLVCLPTYREGLPKALLEAAACARPIVASDVPGCREIVGEDDNGLLVPVRDVDALTGALRALILNPARLQAMSARGPARAGEFATERVVAQTLELYETLLGRGEGIGR